MNRLLSTDPLVYLLLFVGTAFTLLAGYLTEQRTLMPVFNALILWPLLIWSLRHARIDVALRLIAFWAAIIFFASVFAGRALGEAAQAAVPGSIEYNAEQIHYLSGYVTPIQQPLTWLPAFVRRAGLLMAGSAISAGLIPLVAGARYLAILGLWIANLLNTPGIVALLLGIMPWTWAEIVAFATLGAVLAEPIVTGDVHALLTNQRRRLLMIGMAALLLALVLHLLLPPLIQAPLKFLIR